MGRAGKPPGFVKKGNHRGMSRGPALESLKDDRERGKNIFQHIRG